MSIKKSHVTTKVAAGAIVALSGFVPQPLVNNAQAATATINVTGQFAGGITLTAGADVKLGVFVATANTGSVSVSTAGAGSVNKAFFNGGVQTNGTIAFNAGTAAKNVDVTVKGFGALTLGGAGATGTATLGKVFLGGPFNGVVTLTGGAGTATDSALNTDITSKTTDIDVGALVSWSGNKPIGTFTAPITVIVAF